MTEIVPVGKAAKVLKTNQEHGTIKNRSDISIYFSHTIWNYDSRTFDPTLTLWFGCWPPTNTLYSPVVKSKLVIVSTCLGCIVKHVSQLRAGGPVIPGLTSSGQGQTRSEHAPGCYGNPICYGDEYYFDFMGGHAWASQKGGRSCSLSTRNY